VFVAVLGGSMPTTDSLEKTSLERRRNQGGPPTKEGGLLNG